jgi:serine/threonine protein kinase
MDGVASDLLTQFFILDPNARPTALEALDHSWFHVKPFPAVQSE